MQIDTEQKRFLENFYKYLANKKVIAPEWRDYYGRKEMIDRFSKKLALGKPEPLAKNKQFENVCPKCNGSGKDGHDRCIPPSWYICDKCDGKGQI